MNRAPNSADAMPNCDFYAAETDFSDVLGFVFAESGCRVFETW